MNDRFAQQELVGGFGVNPISSPSSTSGRQASAMQELFDTAPRGANTEVAEVVELHDILAARLLL